jgi:hypothetical protein
MAIDGSDQPRDERVGRLDVRVDEDVDHHAAQRREVEERKENGGDLRDRKKVRQDWGRTADFIDLDLGEKKHGDAALALSLTVLLPSFSRAPCRSGELTTGTQLAIGSSVNFFFCHPFSVMRFWLPSLTGSLSLVSSGELGTKLETWRKQKDRHTRLGSTKSERNLSQKDDGPIIVDKLDSTSLLEIVGSVNLREIVDRRLQRCTTLELELETREWRMVLRTVQTFTIATPDPILNELWTASRPPNSGLCLKN